MPTRTRLSVAELLERPVRLRPEDASALVRRLSLVAAALTVGSSEPATTPFAPEHVWLDATGGVRLRPGVHPTVADLGRLLERLLADVRRRGPVRIPPGMVFATARATGQIDAPPLPSPRALARALERFDPPDCDAALRSLFEAGMAAEQKPSPSGQRRSLGHVALLAASGFAIGVIIALGLHHNVPVRRLTGATDVIIAKSPPKTESGSSDRPAPVTPPRRGTKPATPRTVDAPVMARRKPAVKANDPRAVEPLLAPAAVDANAAFSPSFDEQGGAVFFHAQSANGSALKRAERDDSGELHVVTIVDDAAKNFHVQLSPDGTSIAFDSDRDGVRGVYLASADGTHVRRVSGSGYAAVPTWSPDGGRLAFLRAEDEKPRVWNLWLEELSTGAMTRLTNHAYGQVWGGAWFPDGRRIAYSHEDRLVLLDLDSRRSTSFRSPRAGHLVRTPAVSPDGRWIIFQVFHDGGWLLDLSDGSMSRVLDDESAEEFTWAPDGRRVAFHTRRNGEWGLWVMAAR